jgi:hypothetical protein
VRTDRVNPEYSGEARDRGDNQGSVEETMDTKWLAGAGIAAVVAFAGALWWSTPSSDASAKTLSAPTAKKTASTHDAKSRKGGAHAKARSGKGGKAAKAGKSAKARGGKAKAGRSRTPGSAEAGAAKWDALRGKLAAGVGGKVNEYGAAHNWDAAKTASVQKLLDDTMAKIDDASARIQSGALQPDAAATEFAALRKDTGKQLVDLIGAEDAKGLVASMKSAGPAAGTKTKAPAAN